MHPPALDDDARARLRLVLHERERTLREEVRALDVERQETPGIMTPGEVEDLGEQGEERTREAVRHVERERDMAELRDIAEACARMDRGAYGVCVDCGEPVPLARLLAQPAAARCLACQQIHERRHPTMSAVPLPPQD